MRASTRTAQGLLFLRGKRPDVADLLPTTVMSSPVSSLCSGRSRDTLVRVLCSIEMPVSHLLEYFDSAHSFSWVGNNQDFSHNRLGMAQGSTSLLMVISLAGLLVLEWKSCSHDLFRRTYPGEASSLARRRPKTPPTGISFLAPEWRSSLHRYQPGL